ncbi:acylase [Pontixanthobacter aestiaquae]|uniref:Acylase n=1 Tax=Pontixanthobacter aestiaquae TaxID=1509367 RepID=A0A844Z7X3_9SPHN|nr:acylase [Pontixanthobacter aestiaquae]MDN3646088.1 acylase [Pontixanthobacter aestiaquae]MXO82920.1 acylase [Pontixanthobacter aestiaquae]
MKSWLVRGGWLLLGVTLTALIGLMVWEPFAAQKGTAPDSDRTYSAEIVRSEFGVPHIYGETDADVAYGVAIAHAEDDFFTLQDVVAMTRGRYGAIAGEEGAQIDYAYHLLDARGTAERHYMSLPEDTRALFEAYATGLNQFAEENPGEVKLANLFPVNGMDVATGFALRQPFFFGLGNVIGPLVAGEDLNPEFGPPIPDAGDRVKPSADAPPIMDDSDDAEPVDVARAHPLYFGEDGALSGSNAWAIAPQKSGDGVTRLVSNSHQPWRGGVAWYELVVESNEGWHYAGANFPGSPFPFLGHNENLGWTNTVNRPDMTDVYELELDDSGENYKLDGEWKPLLSKRVILPVKMGPLVLPVPQTVYRSEHGPVIKNDKGAFAIRYGGMDSVDMLDAYYRLNKAENFEEWKAILARMDIPSTNFIYGDKEGNIAYVYNAAIPDRPVGPDWRNILPGNDSSLIWEGTVDFDAIPKIYNPSSGWVYNSNNTPYSAAGPDDDIDPDSVAPEMGVELKETNRSRRTEILMAQHDIIDRGTLEDIKYDTGYVREDYVDVMMDGVAALDLSDDPELAKAQALLAGWDMTSDSIGSADAIALLMIRPWMSAEYQNKPLPDAKEELTNAAEHLLTHFDRLDPPMSELLRLRQGDVDLPLDGGSDTLRASTLWNVDDDGRLSVRHGDSFLMFVEWEPGKRVRSESIQPYGAATTRPDSPHFADQAALFVKHELKPVHFWRVDALKAATVRKTVSNR